jgi:DNA-binding beta-propeller fold protein YncE
MAVAAGCAAASTAYAEQVITVPGFADFLAVDGDSVWATNAGGVERWSRQGKLAAVAMTHPCGAMAISAGALWVADCKEGTLVRIDTQTAQRVATIPTGIANPKGELNVVAGAGSIWVASDQKGVVSRVDPATNRVTATIPVNLGTHYLAFGFGSVWAVSSESRSIQRIDPATNAVAKTTALGKDPGFLAAGEGGVWVQEQGDGTVVRIDPQSGDVTGRTKVGTALKWGDIDTGGGLVWLRTTEDQTFVVIDPKSLAILARVGKAEGSGALRFTESGVWTSAHDVHTLTWWPEPAKLAK